MTFKTIPVTVISLFLFGCASPHVVQERQISDNKLSCSGISDQIAEAEVIGFDDDPGADDEADVADSESSTSTE